MTQDVSIFLDLDNILIGATEADLPFDIQQLLAHVQQITSGRVVLRKAYGDWRQNKKVPQQLAHIGFELQSVVRLGQMSKNLADMQMVIDVMETLVDGHEFKTYVLVTGDRDFMPLVQALRKRGKFVLGIGVRHSTSMSLVNLCDLYIYYDDIIQTDHSFTPEEIEALLTAALDNLLTERDVVPASQLKQALQEATSGAFGRSAQGHQSFRKLLKQYDHLVALEQEGSALYVGRPRSRERAPAAAQSRQPSTGLDESGLAELIQESLNALLVDRSRVRASLLKEEMQRQSGGAFDENAYAGERFRDFLARFPAVVALSQQETTLYAALPEVEATDAYLRYRSGLKKRGLRVVPADVRLRVLKDAIRLLQGSQELTLREVIDSLAEKYALAGRSISKSQVNDVMRIARRAGVVELDKESPSAAQALLKLRVRGDRSLQDAIMLCDAAFLEELGHIAHPLDLEQAALALYDNAGRERYLKVLCSRFEIVRQKLIP